ncbi:DNA repair protein, partial [Staphylococcus felis]
FQRQREEALAKTIDELKKKYGNGIVSKAISYTESGTKNSRLGLMAGHKM